MRRRLILTFFCLCACLTTTFAQQRTVTGIVTDQSGNERLPGVSVSIKGSTRGTITDATGSYSITADAAQTLVFSFIGYAALEQVVGNRTTIGVSLKAGANNLDEVVVVGYGTQKRANLTGSVSAISREELLTRQVATSSNLLQGLAPGVTVTQ